MSTAKPALKALRGLPGRSCVQCRKRKIKCDKTSPSCGQCMKGGFECVYITVRVAKRPRQNVELLAKLAKLEGVVQKLSGLVHVEEADGEDDSSGDAITSHEPMKGVSTHSKIYGTASEISRDWSGQEDISKGFQELVVKNGKSRYNQYISSSFWATLTAELDDVRGQFEDESDEEWTNSSNHVDTPSAIYVAETDHQFSFFGLNSSNLDLTTFHPLPSQIMFYWEKYMENVEPLTKILHIPTITSLLKQAITDLKTLSGPLEALMFAIFYATITSLDEEDVQNNFGVERQSLLAKYSFATEQALAKADFLRTSDILTVQAFVLYVFILRTVDARSMWALIGMVVRLAYALGLHRDGVVLQLKPFDTQIRRRLWYQICNLDIRASDLFVAIPSIGQHSFDTELPLNINDSDIWPEMTEMPSPRTGLTEMTIVLIRSEIDNVERILGHESNTGVMSSFDKCKMTTHDEKEGLLSELAEHLEFTYLKYCDQAGPEADPMYTAAAKLARIGIANLSIIKHNINDRKGGNSIDALPQPVKDRLFETCIERIEYTRFLKTDPSMKKIGWIFKTQVQWYAIAYVLREVGLRAPSELVQRGWRAVEATFGRWAEEGLPQKSNKTLWRPMRKLMDIASRKREADRRAAMETPDSYASNLVGETLLMKGATGDTHFHEDVGLGSDAAILPQAVNAWHAAPGPTSVPSNSSGYVPGLESELYIPTDSDKATDQSQSMSWMFDEFTSLDPQMDLSQGAPFESWDDVVRDFNMNVDPSTPGMAGVGRASWWMRS